MGLDGSLRVWSAGMKSPLWIRAERDAGYGRQREGGSVSRRQGSPVGDEHALPVTHSVLAESGDSIAALHMGLDESRWEWMGVDGIGWEWMGLDGSGWERLGMGLKGLAFWS
jgi:hypothetical protein